MMAIKILAVILLLFVGIPVMLGLIGGLEAAIRWIAPLVVGTVILGVITFYGMMFSHILRIQRDQAKDDIDKQ